MFFLSKKNSIHYIFYALLIPFIIFYILPIIIDIYFSFVDYGVHTSFVLFDNYLALFNDPKFIKALTNTLFILLCTTLLLLVLAYPLAHNLNLLFDKYHWIKIAFLVPLLIPSGTITYIWNILFDKTSTLNALPVILLFIWKNCGYHILIFTIGLTLIPKELYEVCSLEGVNKYHFELYMRLPLMRNSFLLSIIISVIQNLKIGREIFLLYGAHPRDDLYVLATYYREQFLTMNIESMSCSAIMSCLVILALLVIIYKCLILKESFL